MEQSRGKLQGGFSLHSGTVVDDAVSSIGSAMYARLLMHACSCTPAHARLLMHACSRTKVYTTYHVLLELICAEVPVYLHHERQVLVC